MSLIKSKDIVLLGMVMLFALAFFVVIPNSALAQDTSFVTCSGPECQACHLVKMADNIIGFLIIILTAVASLIFAYAGFVLVTSGGDVEAKTRAKTMFTNVLIGYIIVLSSWLIIDTMMKALLNEDLGAESGLEFGVWNEIKCMELPDVIERDFSIDDSDPIVDESGIPGAPAGSSVEPAGELCSYEGKQFDCNSLKKIKELHNKFDLRLTSGYRSPEHNARVNGSPTSHHLTGRAADFVGSASEMQRAADWARSNGAREVIIHNAGSGTHLHVVF